MTEEIIVRARQNCCRLCLAPDSECVPILTSLAADKEPLSSKIHACVNVKINTDDRLSLRVCHSCISFLNSWQSFKNRCLAAQMKQMNWLEMAKNSMRRQIGQMQQPVQPIHSTRSTANERLNQNQKSTKGPTGRPMPVPFIIKEEPIDEEADAQEAAAGMKLNLDPNEFLDGTIVPKQEFEEEETLLEPSRIMNDEPHILTSLGLTQIRRVNPYNQMLSKTDGSKNRGEIDHPTGGTLSTQCRFCNMNFSSATNARRHERNIHQSNSDGSFETPKLCIKPTTTRSLLKPLHNLKANLPSTSSSNSMKSPPPVTPEMMGVYDYSKPEKYRHLLTDSKLAFIRKHEEFLKQYQTMTCTCCPQTFPTYKTFMAHMRRKFPNLARNLCFKCLKQFQSKTFFVAHLKKRNCINLYKLYKNGSSDGSSGYPERVGTKEILNNKVYECKLCSKTFRLKLDFRSHVYEAHGESIRKDASPGRCGFCSVELDDPLLRRRHYNNMECIVMIHCGTCKQRFEFHQQFIDHVYEAHLPIASNNNDVSMQSADTSQAEPVTSANMSYTDSFNSRLPHSCNICGQTYNNYYNVLRHMEAKHPDQVPKRYICEKCDIGFPRQGPLRDHMYEVHGTTIPRARRELLSCRMCSDQFESREKWIRHQTEQHSRYTCCFCAFQGKSLDKFKEHIETHSQLALKNAPIPISSSANVLSVTNGGNDGDDEEEEEMQQPAKKLKLDSSAFQCPVCHATFSGNVALSNHMRSHYNNEGVKFQGIASLKNSSSVTTPKSTTTPAATSNEVASNGDPIRRIRCHLCSKRFTSKKTYRKHMLIEHNVRNVSFIKCSVCKAEFTHERGLRVHMYKAHGTLVSSDIVFNATYECEICDAEFKSEKSLNQHKGMVHKNRDKEPPPEPTAVANQNSPAYWHQCQYCPAHFDSNKKLAIHLNSHTEFDAHDYSCKDCGNVYSGRKSLWVHRYKKHREVPEPSPCGICKKVFFSNKMLQMHARNHTEADSPEEEAQNNEFDASQTMEAADNVAKDTLHGDESEEEEDLEHDDEQNEEADGDESMLPVKVQCAVCSEEFSDQDLFDKHMEMHQMELYTDNPLAAMFDTGPEDPNQYFRNQMSENGGYTCDICPKSFPALTALKVHRNWHFRQDAKLVPADPKMRFLAQSKKASNVCEFCDTAFSSTSNLRRHIVEVHNRDSFNDPARSQKYKDKYMECTKCTLKFDKKSDWVRHKIKHAKDTISSSFEWGCEICGKIVSRKERLLQHMNSHLKSKRDLDDGNASVLSEDQSNSQDTVLSNNTGRGSVAGKPRTGEDDEADDEIAGEENVGENDEGKKEAMNCHQENIEEPEESINDVHEERDSEDEDENGEGGDGYVNEERDDEGNARMQYDEDSSQQYQEVDPDQEDIQDEEDEEDEDGEEEDDEENMGAYSCDLCQVYFETSKQLRRHVTSHFLNGPGSVTLTEIPKDKSAYTSKLQAGDDVTTITPV